MKVTIKNSPRGIGLINDVWIISITALIIAQAFATYSAVNIWQSEALNLLSVYRAKFSFRCFSKAVLKWFLKDLLMKMSSRCTRLVVPSGILISAALCFLTFFHSVFLLGFADICKKDLTSWTVCWWTQNRIHPLPAYAILHDIFATPCFHSGTTASLLSNCFFSSAFIHKPFLLRIIKEGILGFLSAKKISCSVHCLLSKPDGPVVYYTSLEPVASYVLLS